MKKLSIDELARRLRAAGDGRCTTEDWGWLGEDVREYWRRIARLARKLESQPAAKPRPAKPKPQVCEACGESKRSVCRCTDWVGRKFYSCERCWWNMDVDEFDQRVAAHRAKEAAKKRGMQ